MFNNFFDDFFNSTLDERPLLSDFNLYKVPSTMRTDIEEVENAYNIVVDLPGYSKENIDVTLCDGILTIKAEKNEEKEVKDKKYTRRERFVGSQSRRFNIPEEIKEEQIKATFENGVLKIEIPKIEKQEPKKSKIEIN